MENLTLVEKKLVNAYSILVLAELDPDVPGELRRFVDIKVAEIEIEKLSQWHN